MKSTSQRPYTSTLDFPPPPGQARLAIELPAYLRGRAARRMARRLRERLERDGYRVRRVTIVEESPAASSSNREGH